MTLPGFSLKFVNGSIMGYISIEKIIVEHTNPPFLSTSAGIPFAHEAFSVAIPPSPEANDSFVLLLHAVYKTHL